MSALPLAWSFTPRAPYVATITAMDALAARIADGDAAAEELMFCVHEPVITLGRSADPGNVRAAGGVPVVRTSRGGDVTAHGPGQLVIYPVMRLVGGVLAFIAAVSGAIVDELAVRGVSAEFRRQPAGIWILGPVAQRKIAALGLRVRRRVVTHGFALNVGADAHALFDGIVPCGLEGTEVTSIERESGARPAIEELASALARRIARVFDRETHKIDTAHRFVSCDRELAR